MELRPDDDQNTTGNACQIHEIIIPWTHQTSTIGFQMPTIIFPDQRDGFLQLGYSKLSTYIL